MVRRRLGVLISGGGSNLQALIDACAAPDFPAEIALVIANDPSAGGLERAAVRAISTQVIDHRDYADRTAFDRALDAALRTADAELICLAGFMRLLTADFVEGWRDRLVNIHPSLLPSFRGLHAHRQALAAGVRITGCTVHLVRPETDSGPILVQAAVPVRPDDDEASLAARVLVMEHRCYPLAIRALAEGRVRIIRDRAEIDGPAASSDSLMNPPR